MIPIFVHDGVDYSLYAIALGGGILLFGLQLLLCFRAKRPAIRLIPVYLILAVFLLALYCFCTQGKGNSFIDLSLLVAAVLAAIGGVYGLFVGLAWLIWYIKNKKLR